MGNRDQQAPLTEPDTVNRFGKPALALYLSGEL